MQSLCSHNDRPDTGKISTVGRELMVGSWIEVRPLLKYVLSLLLCLAFTSVAFGAEVTEKAGGQFTLEVRGNGDSPNPIIHTVWSEVGSVAEKDKIDELLQQLSQQDNLKIQIITSESKTPDALQLQFRLRALGLESIIIAVPDKIELQLALYGLLSPKVARLLPPEVLEAIRQSVPISPDSPNIRKQFLEKTHASKTALRKIGKWWKDRADGPNTKETVLGLTLGAFKFETARRVWFNLGLPPEIAGLLVAAQTGVTLAMKVWLRTSDNIFGDRIIKKSLHETETSIPQSRVGTEAIPIGSGKHKVYQIRTIEVRGSSKKAFWKEFLKRQGFELSLLEIYRMISGAVGAAHSAFSWVGQGELLFNLFAFGTGTATLNNVRHETLTRRASMWTGFFTYIPLTTLQMLDLAGHHFFKIVDYGVIQINGSTATILVTSLAASAFIKWKPHWIEKGSEILDKGLEHAIHFTSKTIKAIPKTISKVNPFSCNFIFRQLKGK